LNEQIINEVVKEVLIRIGHLKPMKLLKNVDYDEVDFKNLENVYGLRTVGQDNVWKDPHPLLIPRLTNRQLISIYNGNPCDLVTSTIIQGLLIGGKIFVFEKDVELLNIAIADTPFTNRYKEAYEVLRASGLEIVEGSLDLERALPLTDGLKKDFAKPSSKKDQHVLSNKEISFKDNKVLGQKQAQSFIDGGMQNLFIGPKQLVTPLAKDMLREAGVSVKVVDS